MNVLRLLRHYSTGHTVFVAESAYKRLRSSVIGYPFPGAVNVYTDFTGARQGVRTLFVNALINVPADETLRRDGYKDFVTRPRYNRGLRSAIEFRVT